MSHTPLWFDAHLDLAYLAVRGRSMGAPVESLSAKGPERIGAHAPAAVTLPSLVEGGVRFVLGTIFTEPIPPGGASCPSFSSSGCDPEPPGPESYTEGDAERAFIVGRAQLEVYLTWRDQGIVSLDLPQALLQDPEVGEMRGGMGVAEVTPPSLARRAQRLVAPAGKGPVLRMGILIENADPIRSPDDLEWWRDRGVCAVGMAWWRDSRYAAGNGSPPTSRVGLTDLGRALARAMDSLGVVHDLSHLSQRSADELLALTDRPVMASHSNCRALLGGELNGANQRHLPDAHIREIARRGGVIGLNLFRKFIRHDLKSGERPTVEDAVAHVEHICEIAGHRRAVGLGSDMDGGITAHDLCDRIERPADLSHLLTALRARGWSSDELAGFACLNWLRFWSERAGAAREASHSAARATP